MVDLSVLGSLRAIPDLERGCENTAASASPSGGQRGRPDIPLHTAGMCVNEFMTVHRLGGIRLYRGLEE